MPEPVLFWDSAALVRAVTGEDHDPFRRLLEWGEMGLVDMQISRDVIRETEHVLRRFGEDVVARLAILLDVAGFATTPDPNEETVSRFAELTGYRPDARIVAAAHECCADVLITYDRERLLGNPLLGPPDLRCAVQSPETCIEAVSVLLREHLKQRSGGSSIGESRGSPVGA